MIIDAHRHVWDTTVQPYPWLDDEPLLSPRHLPEDADDPQINGTIFVQAGASDGRREARWVQGLAGGWPALRGIVAFAPVDEPDHLPSALDELEELPLFVGVRRLIQDEPDGFLGSAAMRDGLTLLAARGVPFDACIRHHQLAALTDAVARSGVDVVLDHLGKPPIAEGIHSLNGRRWTEHLRQFAALPGTSAKLSGLAPEADGTLPLEGQVRPFLEVALEAFGPTRLMVGSDWPVSGATPHALGFDEWFALVRGILALDEADESEILGGAAARHYGFTIGDDLTVDA